MPPDRTVCPDCGTEMRGDVVSVHRALRHSTGRLADELAPVHDALGKGRPIRKAKVRVQAR